MRLAALLVASLLCAGCDDTNERRAAAIQATRGTDEAAAERGAAELEKILEKSPRDRLALYALATHFQRHGRVDDARYLYERLVVAGAGQEEGERAKEELAKIALPPASAVAPPPSPSASIAPSLAVTAIVPGKGVTGLSLGASREEAEKLVGRCEEERVTDDRVVCVLRLRGMELVYKQGKVARVGLYGEGRELVSPRGERAPFRPFVGATAEGLTLGVPAAEAEAKLGPPITRRAPNSALITRDGNITMELWDYPKRGLTLEIDQTPKGPIVSGIQIPTIEGRPLPSGGKP